MNKAIRHGKCTRCLNDDLDIFNFIGEEMCLECSEEVYIESQLEASELEACEKYYASDVDMDDWLPEDEEDDQ